MARSLMHDLLEIPLGHVRGRPLTEYKRLWMRWKRGRGPHPRELEPALAVDQATRSIPVPPAPQA